jgi:HK97 family phage prohead protease
LYTLEKAQRIDKSFAITSVTEKALVQNDMVQDEDQWIDISGYASRAYSADGKFIIDADQEHVKTFGMDLKRLVNGTLPILFNHQQDKPVGKVLSATYDKDGLLITARIFKYKDDELTNFVYNSVKSKVITAFSVGMLVKGFDVVTQDGEDYLQLSESEVIEVSLVAVPSNAEALFQITNLKSITGEDKVVTLLAKSLLKAENSDACNGFECAIKKSLNTIEVEPQKELLVEKNTEEKETVLGVTPEAQDQLEELQKEEVTPIAEDTQPVEGETITISEDTTTDTSNDKPSETAEEVPLTPAEVLSNDLSKLVGMDISKLSDSEVEQVYETLAPIISQIEARVVAQVAEAMRESMMVVAPE